jgi:cytochrome c peroxidase
MILTLLALALVIPLGLDLYMPVPEGNPVTEEKVALGRRLFHDRRLSRDRSIACASCHDPDRAFNDGRRVAIGVFKRTGRRNAPALINRGYGRAFFWDGRIATLEEQVLKPIQDPNEMDMTLAEASAGVGLRVEEISVALASYVRSIFSGNSRFDRYINGNRRELSREEQTGLRVFRGKGNCTLCHVGPTFTDERFHNTGVAWHEPPQGSGKAGSFADEGRFPITRNATDRGAFKTPTLREVVQTAPYMHDGSIATLSEVIDFYDRGGRANPFLDPEVRQLGLTGAEKRALEAFLRTLSGTMTR